jgi:Mrp family chromosome partitioning ATPase
MPSLVWIKEKEKRIGDYAQYYDVSGSLVAGLPLGQSSMSGQILVIESATAGEGKTTVLAKSAISMARGGLRVVMVDADIQRSSLHRFFGLNNNGEGGASGLTNVMRRILSKKIRNGSLDKFSVADLFFLVALKKQSGKLIIKNESSSMTGVFEDGRLFHLQSPDIPFANRLGTMLLRGGFITESQLKDALERNKRTGQPLGYILINAGYITQDQLQGPLKLQMEEHLQKLFSWKQGDFTFEPGSIETYEDRRIYFQEDYTPIINRLSRMTGSRLLEREVIASVKTVNGSNLSILPAGIGNTITPYGPLYFTLLAKFLQILKERFDVVLIDAPPILETMGGSRPLLSLADGIIFVAKSGHVSVKHIEKATTYMRESKVKIIGTVLNQVKKGNYYYKY